MKRRGGERRRGEVSEGVGGGQSAVPVLVRRRWPGEASVLALPWQPSASQVTVQISGVNAQDHA